MTETTSRAKRARPSEISRTASQVGAKLRARGVAVRQSDSPDDIVAMLEAVETFELAVESAGGDLMMDEPPVGSTPQPDHATMILPERARGETAREFIEKIVNATGEIE